jgi:hypothetical protein
LEPTDPKKLLEYYQQLNKQRTIIPKQQAYQEDPNIDKDIAAQQNANNITQQSIAHSIDSRRQKEFGSPGMAQYVNTNVMPEGLSPEEEERFLKLRALNGMTEKPDDELMKGR